MATFIPLAKVQYSRHSSKRRANTRLLFTRKYRFLLLMRRKDVSLQSQIEKESFRVNNMNLANRETRDKIHIRITIDYAKWCFENFNCHFFDSMVPMPLFFLEDYEYYASKFTTTRYKDEDSDKIFVFPTIYLNENMFLTKKEWQDAILHEMIHIFLWCKNAEDEQPHGPNFTSIMRYLNKTYKRHIRIRYKGPMLKRMPKMPCKQSFT